MLHACMRVYIKRLALMSQQNARLALMSQQNARLALMSQQSALQDVEAIANNWM